MNVKVIINRIYLGGNHEGETKTRRVKKGHIMHIGIILIGILLLYVLYFMTYSKERKLHTLKLLLRYMRMCNNFIATHSKYKDYFDFIEMEIAEDAELKEFYNLSDLSDYKYRTVWIKEIDEFKFYVMRYGNHKNVQTDQCVCIVNDVVIGEYYRTFMCKEAYELNYDLPKQMIKNIKSTTKIARMMIKNFKKNTKYMKSDSQLEHDRQQNKLIKYYEEIV